MLRESAPSRVEIVRHAGAALWAQIEQQLAAEIARGELRPNGRIASEHELAARFGVNRHTIRQALSSLARKGLVRVEHGRGTFVESFALAYTLNRRTRFSENLAAAGRQGTHELVASRIERARGAIASRLKLESSARVVCLETLGEMSGRPVSYGEHYFPARRFEGLAQAFVEEGSISRALKHFGVADYTRRQSTITARLPEESVAALLKQPKTHPILFVESINVDSRGRPLEFGRAQFSAQWVELVVKAGR